MGARKSPSSLREGVRAFLLFVGSLDCLSAVLGNWGQADWFTKGMPTASETLKELWWWVTNPFFNNGPNDLGLVGTC
jgi:nitrate/nitrite transport system permease protein